MWCSRAHQTLTGSHRVFTQNLKWSGKPPSLMIKKANLCHVNEHIQYKGNHRSVLRVKPFVWLSLAKIPTQCTDTEGLMYR